MKYLKVIICFVICSLPVCVVSAPVVQIDQPVHTFDSIPEGQKIIHRFVIKNTGDELLKILNVSHP